MTARELTEHLGREPTGAFDKGTLMSPRNPRSQRREESLWLLQSDLPEDADRESRLDWAADTVVALRERLASLTPGSVDVFVGWEPPGEQNGFVLRRELLAKLASVPLDVVFDVYVTGRS